MAAKKTSIKKTGLVKTKPVSAITTLRLLEAAHTKLMIRCEELEAIVAQLKEENRGK